MRESLRLHGPHKLSVSVARDTVVRMPTTKGLARKAAEQVWWGDLFASLPGLQEYAQGVRFDLASGLGESETRARLKQRLEADGLSTRKVIFPGLNRKVLRMTYRKALFEIAEWLSSKKPRKRLGEVLDDVLSLIGWDTWLEDFIFHYAATGETSAIHEVFTGKVHTHYFGPAGDKTPVVFLAVTPASDLGSLIEEFEDTCRRVLPDETFSKRHAAMYVGARYVRRYAEGVSYADQAREEIEAEYHYYEPGSPEFEELVEIRRKTITKQAERAFERGDRISDYVSPESEG